MLENGVNLVHVAGEAGHKTIESTKVYQQKLSLKKQLENQRKNLGVLQNGIDSDCNNTESKSAIKQADNNIKSNEHTNKEQSAYTINGGTVNISHHYSNNRIFGLARYPVLNDKT